MPSLKQELPLNFTHEDWRNKKFLNSNATIRIGTLFSGIGAVEHAFKRLNLNTKIMFACDNDPFVEKSYLANYEIDKKNFYRDVDKTCLNAQKYKYKIDLLVGGSPCQSFSAIGARKGFEDTRGTLFYDFASVISECRPKIFIFENVKGLLSHDQGKTWARVQEVFEKDLGYHL